MTVTLCPGCTQGTHPCTTTPTPVPTGRWVPDTDPYRERTQDVAEFAPCACQPCAHARGGLVVVDGGIGHVVVVSDGAAVQARCTCGWVGPDRTGDPHAVALVVDDTAQHMHAEGLTCPEHQPPDWPCPVCEQRGAA